MIVVRHSSLGSSLQHFGRLSSCIDASGHYNRLVSERIDDVTDLDLRHRCYSTQTTDVQSTAAGATVPLKAFSEIPGPKGLPFIGTLWDFLKPNGLKFNKMFEVLQMRSKEYGPIYKETIGNLTSVIVTDLEEYAKVIHVDGKYPNRIEMEPLAHYRRKRKMGLGTVNGQGEEWYKYRKILIRKMLPLNEVLQYVEPMDRVADDFVTRLRHVQALSRDRSVPRLEFEVFKWALESIGCVLFEERIGCLFDPTPQQAQEFIENLMGFFKYLQSLMYGPPFYKFYQSKTWKTFEKYADTVTGIGQKLVNKKLEVLQKQKACGVEFGEKEEKSAFLTYLLSQTDLTPQEVNSNCVDLMMGAVETTSNGLMWTLYCLAKNPDIQDAVFHDTEKVLPGRTPITADSLQRLQHVKACLKEAFRLYPITFATSRRIAKDIELFGYHIPAGTHCQANLFGIGRNEQFFPDAERFQPERWLRSDTVDGRLKTLASLTFGHGPRMCIGRRFAEQEIYIVLTKIIQNFRLEYHADDVKPVLNTVMTADRPLKISFIPRQS